MMPYLQAEPRKGTPKIASRLNPASTPEVISENETLKFDATTRKIEALRELINKEIEKARKESEGKSNKG